MDSNDPLRVISKLKNNRLMAFREALGMSAPKFAEYVGIGYGTYIAIEGLYQYPSDLSMEKLEKATGMSRWELFPDYLKRITRQVSVRTIDEPTILALSEVPDILSITDGSSPQDSLEATDLRRIIQEAIATLNPNQQIVMQMRMGGKSLRETAKAMNYSAQNIRVIELRALQKLRKGESPSTRALRDYEGYEDKGGNLSGDPLPLIPFVAKTDAPKTQWKPELKVRQPVPEHFKGKRARGICPACGRNIPLCVDGCGWAHNVPGGFWATPCRASYSEKYPKPERIDNSKNPGESKDD